MGAYWIGLAGILVVVLLHAAAWHLLEDWVDARKHERRREVWDRIRKETDCTEGPAPAVEVASETDGASDTGYARPFEHPWRDL